MTNFITTKVLSISVVLLISFAIIGADGTTRPAAVLHATGKVQVNHAGSRSVTTLFPGDSVQTDGYSVANIIAGGSSVLVPPSGSVIFMGNTVELMQGQMTISTSAGMSAIANGFTISPISKQQSKFDVTENEDTVVIASRQGSLSVNDGQQTSTVSEGQETTKKKRNGGDAPAAAKGGIRLSKRTKLLLAAGGAVGATAILLEATEDGKRCISSSGDKKCKCDERDDGKRVCEKDDD
ncbi:MAG: hypothetical protein M3O09_18990 [Acidobacteriota bacterium]|nr:hypothetical protein [Acidobacteriota bacterium]